MKKVLQLLKDNAVFAILSLISLVFFVLALIGDYQTTTHVFHVDHYTFLNGGAKSAIIFVIGPAIFLVAAIVLKFFVPKDRMKFSANIVSGLFLLIALASCVFLLLLVIVIPDQSSPNFTQLGDVYNNMVDVYYSKTFNFPYVSMVISLVGLIVLGCYGSATCSE